MTSSRRLLTVRGLRLGVLCLVALWLLADVNTNVAASRPVVPADVMQQAIDSGRVTVLVQFAAPELRMRSRRDDTDVAAHQQRMRAGRSALRGLLSGQPHRVVRQYGNLPFVALDATPDVLRTLEAYRGFVVRVDRDFRLRRSLAQSTPQVQATTAWGAGFDGAGTVIAVIDDGVDLAHPFLAGKGAAEACFVRGPDGAGGAGGCFNGGDSQIGTGAGRPCTGCSHGTHVAGIAAGDGAGAGQAFNGVAKGARLVAVRVFEGESASFVDVVAALDHVFSIRNAHTIAAVNMSLSVRNLPFSATCDAEVPAMTAAIGNLRSAGIPTVISSGNDGFSSGISFPACVSSAISVGSVADGSEGTTADVVASSSNSAPFLSLLAPGQWIESSVPGNGFASFPGTSMAAPHVAGALAILKQAVPANSVTTNLTVLQSTGRPVVDARNGRTFRRLAITDALTSLGVMPSVQFAQSTFSVNEDAGTATLTVNRTGSVAGIATVQYTTANGTARAPDDYTQTQGTITFAAGEASRTITIPVARDFRVEGPETVLVTLSGATGVVLGSPSTAMLTIVDVPPTVTATPATAPLRGPVTVEFRGGLGRPGEWIGMFPANGSGSYVDWQWVTGGQSGGGIASGGTLTFPSNGAAKQAGTYVFRWISQGETAQSATVTLADVPATPVLTSLDPGSVIAGSGALTLRALGSGFAAGSVLRLNGATRTTTVVSATELTTPLTAADVATAGTVYTVTVFTAPVGGLGGGESAARTLAVVAPPPAPTITSISPTSAAAGASSLTLTVQGANYVGTSRIHVDGVARPTTFVSATQLTAAVPATDLVAAGTRSITVVTPAPGGGTSIAVLLQVLGPSLSISPSSGPPGTAFTVTLANWSSSVSAWLALARAADPPGTYLAWTWVSSLGSDRQWTVTPFQTGTYEIRGFANGARFATSPPFSVTNPTPVVTALSPATVSAGQSAFTLTITGSGFVTGATATVGGVSRTTVVVSATMLRIGVAAADVTSVGSVAVQVTNPAPCTGDCRSNVATLAVTAAPAAQVRFLNNLVVCTPTCQNFVARLTSAQGYAWVSASGTPSAYQTVTHATLSNFSAEAIGFGNIGACSCPQTVTPGRRYRIQLDIPGETPVLLLIDEGAIGLAEPATAAAAVMGRHALPASELRFERLPGEPFSP